MRTSLLGRAGLACGIVAPLWWGAMIAYCASRFPGYEHTTDFISELAARAAPTELLMRNLGFFLTGGLYVLFALTAGWRLRSEWRVLPGVLLIALAGFARIGAGVFACEPGCDPTILSSAQDWHYRYASAGYALMMVAAVTVGFALRQRRGMEYLLACGIGVAMWSAVFLFLMETSTAWPGLFQRFASGLLSLWMVLFAVTVWRADVPSAPRAAVAAAPTRRGRRQSGRHR